jgi:hypothetical protein
MPHPDPPEPLGELPLDLAALAAVGPFFALEVGTPADLADDGWRSATELIESPDVLRRWVEWGASRLGTADRVVTASLLYQGWAARFTSVFAGSVVLSGAAPDLAAAGLWYRYPPGGGAIGLAVSRLSLVDPRTSWRRLVDGNLSPLGSAVRRQVRIGSRLLWGNVASAFAGTLATLDRAGHGPLERLVAAPWARPAELGGLGSWAPPPAAASRSGQPTDAERGRDPGAAGSGGLGEAGDAERGRDPGAAGSGQGELRFRRTTCCLYERLPGAGRCGDCSLGPG